MRQNFVAVATVDVDVELAEVNLSDCSTANSSRIGADHLARTTPFGPEVDQDRLVRRAHNFSKRCVGQGP